MNFLVLVWFSKDGGINVHDLNYVRHPFTFIHLEKLLYFLHKLSDWSHNKRKIFNETIIKLCYSIKHLDVM